MTFLKKISLIFLTLTLFTIVCLSLTSCGDEYENGILYNGNAVIGADKNATELTVKDGATSIATGAFADCENLTSLTLPDSITEIAQGAFDGCNALIKSEGGIKYVDGWVIGADENATEITVKDGTRGIAREAFIGMTSLKSAVIPNSVKHIGARAFFRCSSLESITLPFVGKSALTKNSTHFGYIFGAFNKEQNPEYVPDSLINVNVTSDDEISDYAFSECAKIKTVTLPNTLKSIGANAFADCTALSGIVIPDTVSEIGDKAFYKCSALTSVKLPENDGFTSIHQYTFAYCSGINTLTIPKSVKEIGACAIARCTSLESIVIESPLLDRIGQQAFDGCNYLTTLDLAVKVIEKGAFQNCIALTDVKLGEGSLKISSYVFNGCSGIVNFSMPKSVTEIGEFAFYACYSLGSINLGEGITSIEKSTFQYCINLTGTVIPASVKSVGEDAFSGCNALITKNNGVSYVDGWITEIQASATSIEITDGISGFADGAFRGAVNLASITYTGTAQKWDEIKKSIPASVSSATNVILNIK